MANQPYLYWVLTPDGGSQEVDANYPLLHLLVNGNEVAGSPFQNQGIDPTVPGSPNAVKFITPYFDPTYPGTLAANADLNILTTGTGAWGLKISHGCAPPPVATAPTVQKNAAGAYHTTWSWTIAKSVDNNQINAPPGQQATFNYTVVVTPSPSNDHITVAGTIDVTNPNPAAITASSVVDTLSNGTPCTLNWTGTPNVLGQGDTNIPYTCQLQDGTDFSNLFNTVVVNWNTQTLSNGSQLAAGHANFTTQNNISFTQTQVVNDCIDVTDSVAGDLGQVCASGGAHTFHYPVTYTAGDSNNPAGTCTTHPNVASFQTVGPDSSTPPANGSDNKSVQVCVGLPLNVTKTATPAFQRTFTWGITKSVDHTQFNVPGNNPDGSGNATANYTVAVTHDQGTDSGWQVTGTITITNPNDWESVSPTTLVDSINNGGSCSIDKGQGVTTAIPATKSASYTYTCTYASQPAPLDGTNTATVSWDDSQVFAGSSSAIGTADANFANVSPTLTDDQITVSDPMGGGVLGTANASQQNPILFTYSKQFTDTGGTCTTHNNTASFASSGPDASSPPQQGSASQSVTVCVGLDLTVTKSATPTLTNTYTWGISKAVDNPAGDGPAPTTFHYHVTVTHDSGTLGNWNVGGTIQVSNPNNWEPIALNGLTDNILSEPNASCTLSPSGNGVVIPPKGSFTFSYDCTYNQAPAADAQTNEATATWDGTAAATPDGTAAGDASWKWSDQTPAAIDDSVQVFDSVDGGPAQLIGTVHSSDPSPKVISYDRTFNNDQSGTCTNHSNQANLVTNTLNINTPSNVVNVSDCIGADLQVSKTATPSFQRTYLWKIVKSADQQQVPTGGTAHYTVTVTQTGVQDGKYVVNGNITVANPNNWEGVSLTSLTDKVDNGGTCTIGGPVLPVTIPASGSQVFPYTCTYSGTPSSLSGTNTATGIWAAAFSPHTTGQGSATFAFTNPTNRVNQVIHVTDPLASPPLLGTLTGTDQAPFTTGTFHYSHMFQPPANGCGTFPNTATITETGQSSSASVTECSLGGLTMGFWHNNNGQGIIKGSSTVGAWLYSTFGGANGPYGSLGPSATGTQVANYFQQVFGAATCSNNCTAMLRAQSFATALNVYFSGGQGAGSSNKIGAFNGNGNNQVPIGSVTIDVSKWAAAFGVPPNSAHQTILAMLQYVAGKYSPTPAPGVFYGGNQALTASAADAFNAINNDQVTLV